MELLAESTIGALDFLIGSGLVDMEELIVVFGAEY